MSKTIVDSTSKIETTGSAKGLVKGLALVDIIAASEKPLRQVDIAELSGMPRPTVIRLLDVLCELDVVAMDNDNCFVPGPRLAAWGQAFLDRLDFHGIAADITQRLVDLSGETVFIGVPDRDTVLYVSATHTPQAVRPASTVGMHNPSHCTGIGKVLLSVKSEDELDALLRFPLERRTSNTLVDRDSLYKDLALTRSRGYAVDEIENEDGIRCVAVPILDHSGATVAAMSVSAPAYRFSLEQLQKTAVEAIACAAEISARLGYRK